MLRYFLIEEYRRHLTITKKYSLLVFPLYVIFFTSVAGIFIEDVLKVVPYRQLITLSLMSTFVYGFGVGSFEFMGRSMEGFTLVNTSSILPISSRKTYMYAFLRDAIYYTILFIVPLYIGMSISTLFSPITIAQISYFSLSILVAMFLGYGASYLSFSLYGRSRKIYIAYVVAIFTYLLLSYFHVVPLPVVEFQIKKNPLWLAVSFVLIGFLSILGYLLTPEEVMAETREREGKFRSYLNRFKDPLLAKEIIDILRGGIVMKSTLTYFIPMILLFIFVRILGEVSGSSVYSPLSLTVMLSIFSTVVYSWLTIMDDYRHIALLPVSPWDIIRTHMKAHVLIVSLVSIPVIFLINFSSPLLLIPSFALFYLNVFYLLSITAYLAGYRVTSMLFDPEVVMKFSFYSVVPGIILTISSLNMGFLSVIFIALTSATMIIFAFLSIKRAKKRWKYFD